MFCDLFNSLLVGGLLLLLLVGLVAPHVLGRRSAGHPREGGCEAADQRGQGGPQVRRHGHLPSVRLKPLLETHPTTCYPSAGEIAKVFDGSAFLDIYRAIHFPA